MIEKRVFLFILFDLLLHIATAQEKVIYYDNQNGEIAYFHKDKVIILNTISDCFTGKYEHSMPVRILNRCMRRVKRKYAIFKKDKFNASAIFQLFFDNPTRKTINFDQVENELKSNHDDFAYFLQTKGFTVMNINYYKNDSKLIDVQFFLGDQMNCEFYSFEIDLTQRNPMPKRTGAGLMYIKGE